MGGFEDRNRSSEVNELVNNMEHKVLYMLGTLALSFMSLSLFMLHNASATDDVFYTAGQLDYYPPTIVSTIVPDSGEAHNLNISDPDNVNVSFDIHLFVGQAVASIPGYLMTTLDYQLYFCPVDDNNTANGTTTGGVLSLTNPGQTNVWVYNNYTGLQEGSTIYITAVYLLEVWDTSMTVIDSASDTHYHRIDTY